MNKMQNLRDNKDLVLKMINEEGIAVKDVAAQFNVHQSNISDLRQEWMGDDWYICSKTNLDRENITALALEGVSQYEIADKFECSQSAVSAALKRWGVTS